jgi:hypothetical protein
MGEFYVLGLSRFVASGKKDDDLHATFDEIDSIARTHMNSHFGDALSDGRTVPEISQFRAIDASLDTHPAVAVSQGCEPLVKYLGGMDDLHIATVSYFIRSHNTRPVKYR